MSLSRGGAQDDPGRRPRRAGRAIALPRRGRGRGPACSIPTSSRSTRSASRTAGPTSPWSSSRAAAWPRRSPAAGPGEAARLVETLARACICPRARHRPPRPEAGQRAADGRRRAQDHRLRPGQAARAARANPERRDRGHAELHGAGAGRGRSDGIGAGRRRLRPGRDPLRDADRPAPVLGVRRWTPSTR